MKIKITYVAFYCSLLIIVGGLMSYSDGPASGGFPFVGEPGGDFGVTCGNASCHNTNSTYGEPIFEIKVMSLDDNTPTSNFTPLANYLIEITVLSQFGTPAICGFGATILDENNNQAGTLSAPSSNAQISYVPFVGRQYAEHKDRSKSNVFSFVWTAGNTETATIYVNGIVADGGGDREGDSGGISPTVLRLASTPLAVELSEFKALPQKKEVLLQWTTKSETDNDYFTVQHSTNGTDFQDIETVEGAGNSMERNTYDYTHETPVNGNNYYRLKIVDTEGKATFSKIEVLSMDISNTISVNIYPQPTKEKSNIDIYSNVKSEIIVTIYTLNGHIVQSTEHTLQTGNNTIRLNSEQLEKGIYMIAVQGDFGTAVEQFIKI